MKIFYVYKWYNVETEEVFYIGKGCGNRYHDTNKRNKVFTEYYNNHPCQSSIIDFFENEEEAFEYEAKMIKEYKAKGQAIANLDAGGKGGCHFAWTDEMKEYMSVYNPMKDPAQKERFSQNNPMKDPKIAAKVGLTHSKSVIINGEEFASLREAALQYNVSDTTIGNWCKKGHNPQGLICSYKDKSKKQTLTKQCKPVIIDDELFFNTIADAAVYLETASSNLASALRQGKTLYKGHKCKYANQQPSQTNSLISSLEGSTTNG